MLAGASIARKGTAQTARPIRLNCDLLVDPKKEKEFIDHFEKTFRPVAQKHTGYVDLKLLKLRSAIRGKEPAGGKFRFSLTYQTEELRQKWIASKDHETVWMPLENMLLDKNFGILLYEIY